MAYRFDLEDLLGTLADCLAYAQAGDVEGLAAYARALPLEMGAVYVAHLIEDKAADGTFAEAVFNILAG